MKKFKYYIFLMLIVISMVACKDLNNNEDFENSEKNSNIILALDWVPNTNHTGIYVAKEKGYFNEEGIKIEIVQPSEDSSADIVSANRAQLGVYFQPNMVKRLVKDAPITAIAALVQHNTGGIMSLKESNIQSPKDLVGKKFSTWEDPIDDATIKYLVNKDGGNWENVTLIPGESTDATTALKTKLFDAIFVYKGWDYIHSTIMNTKTNFFLLTDFDKTFDYYSPILIANNEFLNKNPELTKKALRAIKKGYEFAAKNPEESAEILIKNAPETDPKFIKESQKYLSTKYIDDAETWGVIDPDRWNNFYNWLYEEKLIDKNLKDKGFTNEYLQ